jgi:hypothetical protein
MKITRKWLKEKGICKSGFEWWEKHKEANVKKLALKLLDENRFDWANWMLTKIYDKMQNIKYAIFAAEQVINIYEKQYPNDYRPRNAIEAAKDYLQNPNEKTAYAAAYTAADAAAAAAAAYDIANTAAYTAAYPAANAAAYPAANAAAYPAANAAAYAAAAKTAAAYAAAAKTAAANAAAAAYTAAYPAAAYDIAYTAAYPAAYAAAAKTAAAYAAAAAYDIAYTEIKQKIIEYGVTLIEED